MFVKNEIDVDFRLRTHQKRQILVPEYDIKIKFRPEHRISGVDLEMLIWGVFKCKPKTDKEIERQRKFRTLDYITGSREIDKNN